MSEPISSIQTLELIDVVQEVESVINHFDQLTEPFKNRHVWKLLYQIREKLGEVEQLPMPLLGDMLACEVNTVSVNGTERENYGLEQRLNPTVMEHWEQRARSLTNPLLKVTYADARWHFSPLNGVRASVDMAHIVIDACFEILETKRYPDPIDARWYAQRAFDLAAKLNDPVRKSKAIETIIKTEDEISVDNKPGLWGFAFDCLLTVTGARNLGPVEYRDFPVTCRKGESRNESQSIHRRANSPGLESGGNGWEEGCRAAA